MHEGEPDYLRPQYPHARNTPLRKNAHHFQQRKPFADNAGRYLAGQKGPETAIAPYLFFIVTVVNREKKKTKEKKRKEKIFWVRESRAN